MKNKRLKQIIAWRPHITVSELARIDKISKLNKTKRVIEPYMNKMILESV